MTPVLTYIKGKGWIYETPSKARQLKRSEANVCPGSTMCQKCGQTIHYHGFSYAYQGAEWKDDIVTCHDTEPGLFEV